MPEMMNALPLMATVATEVLLLLTAYAGLPPLMVNEAVTPTATVRELGAVVNKGVGVLPEPTVRLMLMEAPNASVIIICAVPVPRLEILSVVPLTSAVAILGLLELDL